MAASRSLPRAPPEAVRSEGTGSMDRLYQLVGMVGNRERVMTSGSYGGRESAGNSIEARLADGRFAGEPAELGLRAQRERALPPNRYFVVACKAAFQDASGERRWPRT